MTRLREFENINTINFSELFELDSNGNSEDFKFLVKMMIRKILIQCIMFLSLKEIYLWVKDNRQKLLNPNLIDERIFQRNLIKMRQMVLTQSFLNFSFYIDSTLLTLSIEELTARINFAHLQSFIVLSQVEFIPNKKSKAVQFLNPESLEDTVTCDPLTIKITLEERENILCGKQKRKDERIKFVFKTLRKTLIKTYKNKTKHTDKIEDLKKRFNLKYFNFDEESIKTYYSNDLSKRTLSHLKRHPLLMKKLKWAYEKEYIGQQVDSICFRKMDDRFANKSNLDLFCKSLFDRQSKHSWNLLDIIYSLVTFEKFFNHSK